MTTFCTFVLMKVLIKRTILYYIEKYPTSKTPLLFWYEEFINHKFKNFNELKAVYGNASIVDNRRVVFNVKGNNFCLVASINFKTMSAYIIWFGTHKEYDKIDVANVRFDERILNFKK